MAKFRLTARRLRRFENRGNVAIIFAMVGGVSMSLMGGTIELSRMASSRASLNAAADAASLAAKRMQMDRSLEGTSISQAAGAEAGRRVFAASAPGPDKGMTNTNAAVTWDADGSARVVASGTLTLIFGGVVGHSTMPVSAVGVATAGADRQLEVTMLLDTTASMFNTDGRATTRFTQMRASAKTFVNTLFDTVSVPDRLRVAVIPWTTTVNVKMESPAAWSNAPGTARPPADYGTRVLPTTTIDRTNNIKQSAAALTTQFAPVGWRGCISGARETQNATDASMIDMEWNALRVRPYNQQAHTQAGVYVSATCDSWECSGGGGGNSPPPPSDTQGNLGSPKKKPESFAFLEFGKKADNVGCVNTPYACNQRQCTADSASANGLDCYQWPGNGTRNAFINAAPDTGQNCRWGGCQDNLDTLKAWACTADYNEVNWNNAGGNWCWYLPRTEWTSFVPISGPNLNCPMPMLGLSGNRGQLIDTIDRLSPSPGGTHADVGLRWGLRSLSPTDDWTNFFGHVKPKPFGGNEASKIMILMTDGANEQAVNFPGYWGCSQSDAPGCSSSPNRATLDARMLNWCSEIRNTYKVELYTVAVNVSDVAAVNLLKQCVGDDPTRAFAVDASELSATFATIARSTFALRIKE